jgi:hypothetical protein
VRYDYTKKNHKRTFGFGPLIEADEEGDSWLAVWCSCRDVLANSDLWDPEPKVPNFPYWERHISPIASLSYHFAVARRLSLRHGASTKQTDIVTLAGGMGGFLFEPGADHME